MKTTNQIMFALLRLLHTGSDKISIRLQSVTNIGINKYVKNDTMHKSQILRENKKTFFKSFCLYKDSIEDIKKP